MKARKESYQTTETPHGARVSLLTTVTGSEFCYLVIKFEENEAETLYCGHSEEEASAIYNEYRAEYLFD